MDLKELKKLIDEQIKFVNENKKISENIKTKPARVSSMRTNVDQDKTNVDQDKTNVDQDKTNVDDDWNDSVRRVFATREEEEKRLTTEAQSFLDGGQELYNQIQQKLSRLQIDKNILQEVRRNIERIFSDFEIYVDDKYQGRATMISLAERKRKKIK